MRVPRVTDVDAKVAPEAPRPGRGGASHNRTPELEAAIGARVRAARIAARMSQGDLGVAVGVSFQQVQKYEKGVDRIAASTLQGFAAALSVHPGSFFDGEIPVPSGNIPNVKAAMRIAEAVQRVRDPVLIKRLLSLVEVLAEAKRHAGSLAQ